MCHELLAKASFQNFLLVADQEHAREVQAGGCFCGVGPLHVANYLRKPRGGPAGLGPEHDIRYSLCCGVCRRRTTPASLRFLGRKVYLGAFVVLASAMRQGLTPTRASRLREEFGVSERTLARWLHWWREIFGTGGFWRSVAGRFAVPVEAGRLPLSLLERFEGDLGDQTTSALRLLAPITTTTSPRSPMAT